MEKIRCRLEVKKDAAIDQCKGVEFFVNDETPCIQTLRVFYFQPMLTNHAIVSVVLNLPVTVNKMLTNAMLIFQLVTMAALC